MSDFSLTEINEKISKTSVFIDELKKSMTQVIIGQDVLINKILIAMLANGHILLEGVPGLAKTLTVNTLAKLISTNFQRIQFTPDMLPADLLGTLIYNQRTGEFDTRKGPIFSNIILADEINRSPAKVQSALLEAMQERQVTIGENTFKLDSPFLVMGTQNPIEQEGTYPLPEAQLDRFMFNLNIDYPSTADEIAIVRETTTTEPKVLKPIMTKQEIASYQDLVRRVPVADNVVEYAVKLVGATRPNSDGSPDFIQRFVDWGAGPRASQYLVLGAKAKSILEGRPTPNINDIRDLALPILRHRVLPNFNAEAEGMKVEDILNQLLDTITE